MMRPPVGNPDLIVLVVEDDENVARIQMRLLTACGFRHHWAPDAEAAARLLATESVDVVLLDLRLPGKSGEVFLREMRASGDETGVIVVTGFGDIETKVTLLKAGADDFVTKPFDISDLEARVGALVRRTGKRRVRTLFDGRIELDPASTSVQSGANSARLTASEFGILWLLSASPLVCISVERIRDEVFGGNATASIGAVKTAISRLRPKLAEVSPDVQLENVRDSGYRLSIVVTVT